MKLYIIDPQHTIYEGLADEVILPGDDGYLAVMDFHQPMIARLKRGVIEVKGERLKVKGQEIKIRRGIAKMARNELVILVE